MEDFVGKAKEKLKELGMSEAEAEIYAFLVTSGGEMHVEELSEKVKLTSGAVDEALASLLRRGAVLLDRNIVRALPPSNVVAKLSEEKRKELEEEMEKIAEASSFLKKELELVYWESQLGLKVEEILEPVANLREMELYTVKLISRAQRSLEVFTERFSWYPRVREELAAAIDRGVKARVLLLSDSPDVYDTVRELKEMAVEVRHYKGEWHPIRWTLADGEELVFVIWATRKDIPKPRYFRPHYTRNPGLVKVFSEAFDKMWRESGEIQSQ